MHPINARNMKGIKPVEITSLVT